MTTKLNAPGTVWEEESIVVGTVERFMQLRTRNFQNRVQRSVRECVCVFECVSVWVCERECVYVCVCVCVCV